MKRYYSLSVYFRRRFGGRVQKIPLDAGFDCPNRDGTISTKGCIFCNSRGSGSGLSLEGMSLAEQWEHWRARLGKKYKTQRFLGYLQSFTNTHGPLEKLRHVLSQLTGYPDKSPLPGLAGLAIGTRPDCLDQEKLLLLASLPPEVEEIWLDLGLQSSNDETLARINRGHDFAAFSQAVRLARDLGQGRLNICAHVIAGLPGEGPLEWLATIHALNGLDVQGIKFHNLYVCRHSTLAHTYNKGGYTPLEREEYITLLVSALERLRPDIVVHRLNGDPAPGELLAPAWAAEKGTLLRDIETRLQSLNTWQGKASPDPALSIPAHFSPEDPSP